MSLSLACQRTLLLASIKGFGLKAFHSLLEQYETLEQVWQLDENQLRLLRLKPDLIDTLRGCLSNGTSKESQGLISEIETWCSGKANRHVLCLEDDNYPAYLKEVYNPPPLVYVEGALEALRGNACAIVGSRKPSPAGKRHAFQFAKALSDSGQIVVSGLALGIDTQAHLGALEGEMPTVAVLATGLDRIYPGQNQSLASELVEQGGALISEMRLGTAPLAHHFPRRNRIISGLSRGVLVVEADIQSGSLITARYALEQNRDVFAIPGSIDNPLSKGCHALIKQGAFLVETVNELLENLGVDSVITQDDIQNEPPENGVGLRADEARLMALIEGDVRSFDQLLSDTGYATAELLQLLMQLEVKGFVLSTPGGYQRMK